MPTISIPPNLNRRFITRSIRTGFGVATAFAALLLAGCATPPSETASAANNRDAYRAYLKSDPLGAYLSNNDFGLSRPTPPTDTPTTLASAALEYLGVKYSFGGDEPDTGFDCSGLVTFAAEKSLGLKLPRRSAELAHEGTAVKKTELQKGDLVFFNTRGKRYSHVGIYLGDHKFIHAPRAGSTVRVESMDITYWKKRYNGARRLETESTQAALK
jgi:cell wall-associated NlpC family hydrolase